MKRNLRITKLLLLAMSGAVISFTAPAVFGQDAASGRQADMQQSQDLQSQDQQSTELNTSQSSQEQQSTEITEPAGAERRSSMTTSSTQTGQASFGALRKTSDLLGTEIRNQQNEKLGEIKDVMIDPQSGRIPFVVVSTGGMFGNKLYAVPPTVLSSGTQERTLVWNIDKEKLRNAPSFERSQWPNLSDPQFSTRVYQYYNAQPYWQSGASSSSYQQHRSEYQSESATQPSSSASIMSEPSGAAVSRYYIQGSESGFSGSAEELDAEGDRVLHLYQRGRGAAEMTDRELKEKGPPRVIIPQPEFSRSYSASEYHALPSETFVESAGAERSSTTASQSHTASSTYSSSAAAQPSHTATAGATTHHFYRVSELIGQNIKNTQDQTIGEVKDLAIDLQSGRIAYAVLSAGGFMGVGDRWVAVPITMFQPSSADQTALTVNVDRNTLINAPQFDRSNWSATSNQEFVSRVYSHYGQQPYWQAGREVSEPAGTQQLQQDQQFKQQDQQFHHEEQQFKQQQEPQSSYRSQSEMSEPAGAPRSSSMDQEKGAERLIQPSPSDADKSQLQSESPEESTIEEPSGAAPDSSSSEMKSQDESATQSSEQSASSESSVSEPAGVASSESTSSSAMGESSSSATSEPSGAQSSSSSALSTDQSAQPGAASSATSQDVESSSATSSTTSDTTMESQSSQSATQSPSMSEPAGAATSSSTATTSDQLGSRGLAEKVRSAIQSDSSIAGAQNIQVTTEGGKIVLKGTVSSESEKDQIKQKVSEALVEDQLQIKGSGEQTSPQQDQP